MNAILNFPGICNTNGHHNKGCKQNEDDDDDNEGNNDEDNDDEDKEGKEGKEDEKNKKDGLCTIAQLLKVKVVRKALDTIMMAHSQYTLEAITLFANFSEGGMGGKYLISVKSEFY